MDLLLLLHPVVLRRILIAIGLLLMPPLMVERIKLVLSQPLKILD